MFLKSDSASSSSDDDDWSCFFEAAVSVEQVAAEQVKIVKKVISPAKHDKPPTHTMHCHTPIVACRFAGTAAT